MSVVNKIQVGGSHYNSKLQHWDVVEKHGIGYLEGCATKYVTRWRKKGGVEDLKKALHYIDKLLELHFAQGRTPRGVAPQDQCTLFCSENQLNTKERMVVELLFGNWDEQSLLEAKYLITQIVSEN